MKNKFLKLKNKILISLMGVVGLSACHSSRDMAKPVPDEGSVTQRDEIMLLYGVMPSDFDEKSIVKDTADITRAPAMYGVPTMDFKVKGRVVDAQGRPLRGMQVILVNSNFDVENLNVANPEYLKQYILKSGDTTASDGTFECQTKDTPWEKPNLLVRDIDGEANGTYAKEIVQVQFPEIHNEGGKGWNVGAVEQQVTIIMKKKE